MNTRFFLKTTIILTLLLSNTISAQTVKCKGGKCFIDVSKFTHSNNIKVKVNKFKNLKQSHLSRGIINTNSEESIVVDQSNGIQDNSTLYNAEGDIVFEHSEYVMSETEKEEYYISQRLEKAELEKELTVPMITIEEEDTKEILLPHSDFYCDNSKQAKFYPDSNEYECV